MLLHAIEPPHLLDRTTTPRRAYPRVRAFFLAGSNWLAHANPVTVRKSYQSDKGSCKPYGASDHGKMHVDQSVTEIEGFNERRVIGRARRRGGSWQIEIDGMQPD